MSENNFGVSASTPSETPSSEASESDGSIDTTLEAAAPEAAAPVTPEVKARNIKKLKLKVDGREFDEDIDLDDNDYITKQMQLAKVASKRMQEFSQLEKDVKSFVEELRKNPRKILADPTIGIDIKQLAAEIIEAEIENSKKSPDQLEREKLQEELQSMKSEREKEKEESKKREFDRLQTQEMERYENLMTQTLDKHSDLPKSPYVVKKMADYLLMGLQKGMDISPEDVVDLVREEIREDLKQMFAVLPEDVVEQIVGKDKINGIRKRNLAKGKAATSAPKVPDTGKGTVKTAASDKKSYRDFFNF